MTIEISESIFPSHKASLHLTHNQHKNYYETLLEYTEGDRQSNSKLDWISDEQRSKAIENDSLWELQWYPNNPVGSYKLLACDLEVLLNFAKNSEGETE